jgi:hypothetical protein
MELNKAHSLAPLQDAGIIPVFMISIEQIRAARALLDLNQNELATAAAPKEKWARLLSCEEKALIKLADLPIGPLHEKIRPCPRPF